MPEVNLTIVEKFLQSLSGISPEDSTNKLGLFFRFILKPDFPAWIIIFQIISVLIAIFFLWVIWRGVFKSSYFTRLVTWKRGDFFNLNSKKSKGKVAKKWENIKKRIESGKESELKLSIMEADSLLEDTLTNMGYNQPTIEDKMRKVGSNVISNIEVLIKIRQIRNNIISDPDYKINADEAKEVLEVYETTLSDLQLF